MLALLTPQSMTQPETTARLVTQITLPPGKTLITAWMGGQQVASGKALLQAAQIPTFDTAEQAIRGFNYLTAYARARQANLEFQRPSASPDSSLSTAAKASVSTSSPTVVESVTLDTTASKALLERHAIPVARALPAATAEQAVEVAEQLGYPVVLKILSPHITHKTEVHGVALNVQNAAEVKEKFTHLVRKAGELRPDARIDGVSVEPMVALASGVELIVGMKRDPLFGPVIMVGFGGVAAELFHDRALELPPVCEQRALHMLQRLQCWPLLSGYRNRPPVDLQALTHTIAAFAEMIRQEPQILEADINPLLASPNESSRWMQGLCSAHQPRQAHQTERRAALFNPPPQARGPELGMIGRRSTRDKQSRQGNIHIRALGPHDAGQLVLDAMRLRAFAMANGLAAQTAASALRLEGFA